MDVVLAGDSSYNALQVDVNHRFSHGLSLRGVYTWSKALDDGDSLNDTTANNAPGAGLESLRFARGLGTWRPMTCRNLAVINAIYDLPFGQGKTYLSDASGVTANVVSGWSRDQHRHPAIRIPVHSAAQL